MSVTSIMVGAQLLSLLSEEVRRLAKRQDAGTLSGGDVQALERLTKMYHTLQCESRDAEKGISRLSEEDLLELSNDGQ